MTLTLTTAVTMYDVCKEMEDELRDEEGKEAYTQATEQLTTSKNERRTSQQ